MPEAGDETTVSSGTIDGSEEGLTGPELTALLAGEDAPAHVPGALTPVSEPAREAQAESNMPFVTTATLLRKVTETLADAQPPAHAKAARKGGVLVWETERDALVTTARKLLEILQDFGLE